jgi:hypothetical protein
MTASYMWPRILLANLLYPTILPPLASRQGTTARQSTGGFMKLKSIRAAMVAAIVACGSTALAKDKPIAANSLRAIQIECAKQYGAYEDPATKTLKFPQTSLTGGQVMIDAVHACVAQKTGKPATPFIRQEVIVR